MWHSKHKHLCVLYGQELLPGMLDRFAVDPGLQQMDYKAHNSAAVDQIAASMESVFKTGEQYLLSQSTSLFTLASYYFMQA